MKNAFFVLCIGIICALATIVLTLGCCTHLPTGATHYTKTQDWVIPEIAIPYRSSITVLKRIKDKLRPTGASVVVCHQPGHPIWTVSAHHVVKHNLKGAHTVQWGAGGRKSEVVVAVEDLKNDLVLLKTTRVEKEDGHEVKPAKHRPRLGTRVWLIGSPLSNQRNISLGIISNFSIHRKSGTHLHRVDAAGFFGSSGGGGFNSRGELIGITSRMDVHRVGPFPVIVPGGIHLVGIEHIRRLLLKQPELQACIRTIHAS